jgi:hypothetical protein
MKISRWLGTLGVIVACGPVAFAATWSGTVFNDANGSGRRDNGEAGVAGVAVSNGAQVVLTDASGRFELNGEGDGFVFVVKPRGWSLPADARGLPEFYRRVAGAPTLPAGALDFPLVATPESDTFRALVFADTQVGSDKEVGYFQRTIIEPLLAAGGVLMATDGSGVGSARPADRAVVPGPAGGRPGTPATGAATAGDPALSQTNDRGRLIEPTLPAGAIAFGVTLGDVVNDHPELYPALDQAIARLGVPWHPLLGNHDLDLGALDDRGSAASFEKNYGPSTSAFQQGRVLFVALNNIRYQGGLRYLGGLTANQFEFLDGILRVTPRDDLVVVMTHIPWFFNDPANNELFRPADRARLFALLQDRPNLLLLSGHTHYQRHVFHGAEDGWRGATPLHEYNATAVSGGFWGGPPDANGIPVATQWDGTPHGYAVLSFDGNQAPRIDYRAARHPATHQMNLWGPEVVALKQSYVSYYANVFNAHAGWKIESRVDDRAFNPMRWVVDWDPTYARQYLAQDAGPNPAPSPRLPDPLVSYHLWRAYLPADLGAGTHTIEVRATDPSGTVFTEKRPVQIK